MSRKRGASEMAATDRVRVDVGGTEFVTTASTLTASSSYFSRILSDRWAYDGSGCLFLDRDPTPFAILLTAMRSGALELPEHDPALCRQVLREAQFLGLDALLVHVKAAAHRNAHPDGAETDATALAAALDAEHGGLDGAIEAGVLPARYFGRAPDPPPEPKPKILQIMPTDCDVRVRHRTGRFMYTQPAHCLALVQHPGQQEPVVDAVVASGDATSSGNVLASERFAARRWSLVPPAQILPVAGIQARYWKDPNDHEKGTTTSGVPMLAVTRVGGGYTYTPYDVTLNADEVAEEDEDDDDDPHQRYLNDVTQFNNFKEIVGA